MLYFSYLWDRHPGPIRIKLGVRFAPHDVIKMSNFCDKIFGGFRSTAYRGSKSPFPIDFAGHHYNSAACDTVT